MNKLKSVVGTFAVIFSIQPLAAWAAQQRSAQPKPSAPRGEDASATRNSSRAAVNVTFPAKVHPRGAGSICEVKEPEKGNGL